jgi:hypothetical protein
VWHSLVGANQPVNEAAQRVLSHDRRQQPAPFFAMLAHLSDFHFVESINTPLSSYMAPIIRCRLASNQDS